jgi:PAS domain S-box-containing protein
MRVLYVATDLRDADVLAQEVRRVAPSLSLEICAGLSELRARPESSPTPDVLLMDCSLTEAEQLQLIHYARVRQLGVPVVGVMGANAATPSAALTAGLDDLLVRGPKFAERLQPALRLSTERYRNVAQTIRDNEKLKRSEARLRLIIEALPTGVVLLDQGGKVLAMNAAGVQLFGNVSPQDIVNRSFQTLIPVEDQPAFKDFLETVSGGEEASLQFSGLHDEGDTPRVCNLRGLCIQRDENGQQAVLGVLDRVLPGAGLQHAWTSDFNLDVAGLAPPLLDSPLLDASPDGLEASVRVTELEARCQTADAKIADLNAELERLRGANDQAEAAEATLVDQVTRAQAQQAELTHEINNLKMEVQLEREQRASAEAQARTYAAAAAGAEDLAKQAEAMATLAGDLEAARVEHASLHDQLAKERAARAGDQAAVQQLHEQLASERSALQQLQAQLAGEHSSVQQLHAQLAEAQGRLTFAQGQAGDVDVVRAERASLVDELSRTRAAHEAAQAAVAEHQARLAQQEQASATQQQELSARFEAQVSELTSLKRALASAAAALQTQREANEQLQAAVARKDGQVRDLEQRTHARMMELEQEHRVAVDRLQELLNQAIKDSQSGSTRGGAGADSTRRGAERVGRLAAAMAGDLPAAADAATEAARAVLAALPPGSAGREPAEKTLEVVQRSQEMARHLLRMSTRYMGQATRVDLSYLVRQQESLLHHLAGPDIELQFDLAGGLTSAELDTQDVTQVLTSLTVAARDALTLGGAIRIATTAQRAEAAEAAARGDHPRPLVLAVTARGYGIRPVSSATCEEVTARCGGLLTTVIEPNVSWTLMAMLPGGLTQDLESREDLTKTA